MLLRALGKYTRQQCMGTNHCSGGGNRPALFNKVPYTAALGIEQEAPLPKHKCDDIQRQNKNCKWQSKRRSVRPTLLYTFQFFASFKCQEAKT